MNPLDPPAIVRQHSLLAEMVSKAKPVIGEFVNIERMNLQKAVQVGNLLKPIQDRCLTENISYLKTLEDLGIDFRRASETIRISNVPAPELAKCKSIRQALRVAGEGSPYPMEQRCRDCRLEQLDKKNCKKCKAKNAPEREPGDDTESIIEAERQEKQALAFRVFDTRAFHGHLNEMKKEVENAVRCAGLVAPNDDIKSTEYWGICRRLDAIAKDAEELAKRCRKMAQPTLPFEKGPHV